MLYTSAEQRSPHSIDTASSALDYDSLRGSAFPVQTEKCLAHASKFSLWILAASFLPDSRFASALPFSKSTKKMRMRREIQLGGKQVRSHAK